MPRKTFANGFPLPASDLNTYLMDQSVQTYADATARTAALATPVEGQMSYLADTNTAYVYDGSSWNAVVDAKNYGATLPNGAAGRNKVINGGFEIWQRATSAAIISTGSYVTADRWYAYGGTTGRTSSRQTTGLTGFQYCNRIARDSGNTATNAISLRQNFETVNSLPFAGQIVTLSFYARAGANYSATASGLAVQLKSGTGTDENSLSYTGSVNVINQTATLTTSWQRFTYSGTVDVTAKELSPVFVFIPTGTAGAADYFEITGVQLETGSIATPFARNGGTYHGELSACQRYYQGFRHYRGMKQPSGYARINLPLLVPMRTSPTVTYKDNAGNMSKFTSFSAADAQTHNRTPLAVNGGVTDIEFLPNNTDSDVAYFIFATADSEL